MMRPCSPVRSTVPLLVSEESVNHPQSTSSAREFDAGVGGDPIHVPTGKKAGNTERFAYVCPDGSP